MHYFSVNKCELKKCLDMNILISLTKLFFPNKYRTSFIKDI
ncbi:hypothetical protein [Enterobacteriaceae endosymbiont of Donacia thalassina]|nr:hypothetical protein [Enterobacteriaceae endosymbiont of Donacia thalassina]